MRVRPHWSCWTAPTPGADAVPGTSTLRLPNGSSVTIPGIEVHGEGPWAAGFPAVDGNDGHVYEDSLRGAAQ